MPLMWVAVYTTMVPQNFHVPDIAAHLEWNSYTIMKQQASCSLTATKQVKVGMQRYTRFTTIVIIDALRKISLFLPTHSTFRPNIYCPLTLQISTVFARK